MRRTTYFLRAAAVIALVGSSTLVLVAPASADDGEMVFTGDTAVSIEYGQYWGFTARFPVGQNSQLSILDSSSPAEFKADVSFASDPSSYAFIAYATTQYGVAPLSAGSYTFKLHVRQTYDDATTMFEGETPTSATLTVEKAKLGLELRVLADPANGNGAVVTAKFTGRFVDEYSSSFYPGSAQSPAGTWNITIKDADGEVATERSVERSAGDDVLATSFYWTDAEPGEQYTASASFTASGVSANNFTIGAAQNFSYTAPESARPVPTSSATAKPDTTLPEATGFGLPLWALIIVIVLILGLGVLVTILSVRLSRRPKTSTGEVQS